MPPSPGSVAVGLVAEEQHERLRRFVDEWRGAASTAALFSGGPCAWAGTSSFLREVSADGNQDPVQLRTHLGDDLDDEGDGDYRHRHRHRDHRDVLALLMSPDRSSSLTKMVAVLAFDCIQMRRFRQLALARFYPRLLLFGFRPSAEDVPAEGELQGSFAKSFAFFNDLVEFIAELRSLIRNLVKQFESVLRNDAGRPFFLSCHLRTVFYSLVEGFSVVATLDEIISQNLSIGHAVALFTRMLHSVRGEPSRFDMVPENVEDLDRAVNAMDNSLTTGLFQRCMLEDFHGNTEMVIVKSNKIFLDEFATLIRDSLSEIVSRLDTMRERPHDRHQIVGLLASFICHSWMTVDSAPEKTVSKLVVDILKRAPFMHMFCNTQLSCLEFLRAQLPPWSLSAPFFKVARKDALAVNQAYLAAMDEALSRVAQSIESVLVNWLVSFDSTVSPTVQRLAIHAMLRMRLKQLTQGVFVANNLQNIIRSTIYCHISLEEPLSKDQVRSLRHAAELLQVVRAVYHRRNNETVQALSNILELAQTQVENYLVSLRAQLEAESMDGFKSSSLNLFARSFTRGKEVDTKIQDALEAVDLAVEMLQGCHSLQRRTILHICLDTLFGLNKLPEETVAEILEMCLLMDMAADIHELVGLSTDCGFLYWSREMMPTCFALVYSQTREARSLQLVVSAFKDGIKLLKTGHVEEAALLSYEKELEDAIVNEVVMPLCRDIETDLRLHVHSAHLKGTVNVNPTKTGVRDLSWFLQLKPLRLETKNIHVKTQVEMYLNAAFYNHAAVALHNWKTYGEMRQLAELKYGLELDDIHLPCQTLEQGVDVLDIMRNIHNFVASYTYNLNTQLFIERLSSAAYRKHINTINVKHVANSIRTHGTGIISTTVNFTYQFLAQKFISFSQFLFDDHIKSRLVKECRFTKESQGNERREYPVVRAQNLNHEIKKLGSNDSGHSYMDQFRMLIAEIGNALGFVRMVRLGGLSYSSLATGHVQEAKNTSFELASKNLGMAPEAVRAGKHLDAALESQNMSVDETGYFNILVNVFSQGLQSEDNIHLKKFVFIVPALIINAVEAMVRAKSKFSKRTRSSADAVFTDDGFVMGLAYVLKVLGQDKHFDSLYWFDSVRKLYNSEKARLEEGLDMDNIANGLMGLQIWSQKLASVSEEDAHNIQMAVKRVSAYLMELELIEFNFSGARIFFL